MKKKNQRSRIKEKEDEQKENGKNTPSPEEEEKEKRKEKKGKNVNAAPKKKWQEQVNNAHLHHACGHFSQFKLSVFSPLVFSLPLRLRLFQRNLIFGN